MQAESEEALLAYASRLVAKGHDRGHACVCFRSTPYLSRVRLPPSPSKRLSVLESAPDLREGVVFKRNHLRSVSRHVLTLSSGLFSGRAGEPIRTRILRAVTCVSQR